MISVCSCKHDYQDSLYGPGRRVFNLLKGKGARCTVCGRINDSVNVSDPKPAPVEKKE